MAKKDVTPPLTKLLDAVTIVTVAPDDFNSENNGPRTFQATVEGTGAVTATVLLYGSNDRRNYILLGTFTLSGTNAATDGLYVPAGYQEFRATVTAITGTGAAVTVTMKE